VGPTVLFDKSFLQSLTVDEAVIFDHFFIPVVCPMFYVETLADLEKSVRPGRTPEDEVRIVAQKTPEMNGTPCAHYMEMCGPNLMGQNVPMTGQIPIIGGKAVRVDERRGVVFEERPEAEAFRRWQAAEFLEVERRFAKAWRTDLNAVDTLTVAAGIRAMGIDPQTCKTFQEAKTLADEFVASNTLPLDRIKLAVLALGLPPESERYIAEQWSRAAFLPLVKYAPFAAHVLTVELFFHIALQANLITPSDRQDIAYLSYLPFCMIFVSSDKLHRHCAPLFLRTDQSFVWGFDLKTDLGRLVERYKALLQEEQEKGILNFAHTPPDDGDFLVTKLWKHHSSILKKQEAESLRRLFDEPPEQHIEAERTHLKPFPAAEPDLLKHLKRFKDAPELPPEEVDFDTANPDVLSVQKTVHKKKGSFWQLPKDLKEQPE